MIQIYSVILLGPSWRYIDSNVSTFFAVNFNGNNGRNNLLIKIQV